MRLTRPALVMAAIGIAASSSFGAHAAAPAASPTPLVLTDQSSDANGLNDQGLLGAGPEGTATPASEASLDIVKATLQNTGTTKKVKKKSVFTCTGFTITLEYAGAINPQTPAIYRLLGNTTVNDGVFQIYYNNGPTGGVTETRYGAGDADDTTALATPAKIEGNKIVLTVTKGDMATFGEKAGGVITSFGIDTRISSGVITAPQMDQLVTDQTFQMC